MTERLIPKIFPLPYTAGALSSLAVLAILTVAWLTGETDSISAQQQYTGAELALHSDNGNPSGIWSDQTTMWVADLTDRKLYAYSLEDGTRLETNDIDLGAANVYPFGIWSDETTIWVLNIRDDKVYAYTLTSGVRDESKDIRLDGQNDVPTGVWSDGTTLWAVDQNDRKLYAYALDGGARQSDKDVTLSIDRPRPFGVWSDGETFWIAYDHHQDYTADEDYRLYAFAPEDGNRKQDEDIAISVDLSSRSSSIWSDGATMWVSDTFHDKLFAYELPQPEVSSDASLSALGLSVGTLNPTFATSTTNYTALVGYEILEATVYATTTADEAEVSFLDQNGSDLVDIGNSAPGHQMRVVVGENVVDVVVTAEDEMTVQTYSLTVTRSKAVVGVASDGVEHYEGMEVEFTVSRHESVQETLDVDVDVSESGTLLGDEHEGERTVTIPSGATSTTLTLATDLNDDEWEPHSTVTVSIAAGDGYVVDVASGSAEKLVNDDDFPAATAALSVAPNPVIEGETVTGTITVTTDGETQPHGDGGTLTLSTGEGTAQASDYGILSRSLFHVAAADFSVISIGGAVHYQAEYAANLAIQEDSEVEAGESIEISMSKSEDSSPSLTLSQPTTFTLNISDNDASLSMLDLGGALLSPVFSGDIHSYTSLVEYPVYEVAVVAAATPPVPGEPIIRANGAAYSDGRAPLSVGENEITVEVPAENATTVETYTIIVTRAQPEVSISAFDSEVYEGQDLVFSVSRGGAVPEPLDVIVAVAETGALVQDSDEGVRTISIPGYATSTPLTVPSETDDGTWEDHSTVMATIGNSGAYVVKSGMDNASIELKDNDFPASTATLVVEPNPVAEGGTVTATVMVATNADQQPHGRGGALTLNAHEGTAQSADYGRFGQTSFQISPSDFSPVTVGGNRHYRASYTAAVVITDDSDTETDEKFSISIEKTDAPLITIPTPSGIGVTIGANDSSTDPTLSDLSLSQGSLSPAFSSSIASYTAELGYEVEQITVTPTKNAGNSEVSFLDSHDANIADADVDIDGHQVNLDVGENVIKVKVTAEDGMTATAYSIAVTRAKPVVSIRSETTEALEGSALIFTVARDASASEELALEVSIDETGTLVDDIEEGSRTVTIAPGAASSVITATTDANDHAWEAHSIVSATIADGDSYIVKSGEGRAETLLKDDDFPSAMAALSVHPVTVAEGETLTATITVTIGDDQQPHGGGGTLRLSPVGGSAQDADYGSLSQTSFPIIASDFSLTDLGDGLVRYQSVYTATISISDDNDTESDETIVIQLGKDSNASQISIADPATATVTIVSNDASDDASLNALVLSEGTLSPLFAPSTASYTSWVEYGVEYVTVTPFKSDDGAEVIFLDKNDDALIDADGLPGHQVKLAVGENAVKLKVIAEDGESGRTYIVSITRANPVVRIISDADRVSEGEEITFTVSRNAAVSESLDLTVDIAETNMLIPDGEEGARVVTIDVGATSSPLAISTDNDDNSWEEHSTVTATITPGNYYAIDAVEGSAQTEIQDDDFPSAIAVLTLSPNPADEGQTVTATITINTAAEQRPHGAGGTMILSSGGGTAQASDYESFSQESFEVLESDFVSVDVNGTALYEAVYTATTAVSDDSDPEGVETFEVTIAKTDAHQISLHASSTITVTIGANDLSMDPNLSGLAVSEGTLGPEFASSTRDYSVNVSYGVESITVTPAISDSNSTVSIDMTQVSSGESYPVSLAIGTNTVQVVVTAQDGVTAMDYVITVTRAKPEVGISAKLADVTEGTGIDFEVSRNAAVSEPMEVTVDVSETGALVPDAGEGSRKVAIPGGATSTSMSVATDVDDDIWEEHSRVTATIAPDNLYTVNPDQDAAEVQVLDDDFPDTTALLSVSPNPVAEGETLTATITILTNGNEQPHRGGGTLELTAVNGTAQADDYGNLSQTSFSVADTDFSLDAGSSKYKSEYTATIAIADDDDIESGESFSLTISKSDDSPATLTLGQPTSVIVDINDYTTGLVELNLSGTSLAPVFSSGTLKYTASVPYSVAETIVTATTTLASSGAPIVKLSGVQDHDGTIPLAIGENEITIEVTSADSNEIRTYTVTVTRLKPEVSVRASVAEANEGDVLGFTLTRSSTAPDTLEVFVNVVEDGELVSDGSLGEGSRIVIIPIGATTTTFAVATDVDDDVWEVHSNVAAFIGVRDSYDIEAHGSSAETLVFDDDFPDATAELSVAPTTVVEGGTVTAEVTVTTVQDEIPHTGSGQLSISTANDTATAGTDYVELTSPLGTVSFHKSDFSPLEEAGEVRYQASKHVNIETTIDGEPEGVEKFSVLLEKVSAGPSPTATQIALVAESLILTVTIQESPEAELGALALSTGTLTPAFSTSTRNYAADVGYGVEQVTVTASKSRESTGVTYTDGNDDEIPDADGTAPGQQVNLTVGENVIRVNVTAQGDAVLDVYTITVTRAKPEVGITATTTDVNEGDRAVFTVSRNAGTSEPLPVALSAAETGSMVTDPLMGEGNRSVIVPSHATSTTLTVVTDIDDETWEPHSTVKAMIEPSAQYEISADAGSAEVRVTDNDFPAAIAELAVAPDAVVEGRTVSALVTVTTIRDEEPHSDTGLIQVEVIGDTATSSSDFTPSSNGWISFAHDDFKEHTTLSGETRYSASKQLSIATVDDSEFEGAETFTVELVRVVEGGSPTDGRISFVPNGSKRVVTIHDNDEEQMQGGGSDTGIPPTDNSAQDSGTTTTNDQSAGVSGGSGTSSSSQSNRRPAFTEGTETTRTVAENSPIGTKVGKRVTAGDRDQDRLTYSLNGDDQDSFTIGSRLGQLYTDVELDREADARYYVTAIVSDGEGGNDSIEITIMITDVDEAPSVSGESVIIRTEEVADALATYSADDPEEGTIDWALSGDDASEFLVDGGELAFRSPPDYEAPTDANSDNTYVVTIEAFDGVHTSTLDVSINVTDQDEFPTPTSTTIPAPTPVATLTLAPAAVSTPTLSPSPTATYTPTMTPPASPTSTPKATPKPTATPTPAPTSTLTPVPTSTLTAWPTGTPALAPTPTHVPRAVPTLTEEPGLSGTVTPTPVPMLAHMSDQTPTEEPKVSRVLTPAAPIPTATPASLMIATEGGSVPAWLMLSITFWAVLATGVGVYVYLRQR